MKSKRMITIIICIVTIFNMVFCMMQDCKNNMFLYHMNAEAIASDYTAEQAVQWANNCASTKWDKDVDGSYGTQCVDLILAYYSYLGVKRSTGNATNYQTNTLPSGWKRVTTSPQPGDIIVWAGNTKINSNYTLSKYGHIGIVVTVSGNSLKTVETNADGKVSYAKKVSRDARYATCFIRPNFSKTIHSCETIATGNYYLKNKSTNSYIQAASASNGANITLAPKKEAASFLFNMTGSISAGYYITLNLNINYTVNPYSDTPISGTIINVYKKTNDGTQIFMFDKVDGGYIIHLKNNTNLCLTANGTGVVLKSRTESAEQIWILESEITEGQLTTTANISTTLSINTTTLNVTTTTDNIQGDANCDKNVDIADVVIIKCYLINNTAYSITKQGIINADVNETGNGLNIQDSLAILKYVLKLISSFM